MLQLCGDEFNIFFFHEKLDTSFILHCNTNQLAYMVCETCLGVLHTVSVNIQDLLSSVVIGHVLNEQGTGYEHIFFLVRTFNID